MSDEFLYLLSNISVSESKKWGAMIKLINNEHIDYIEDVLAEHFDLEYEFKIVDDGKKEYVLYFEEKAKIEEVEEAVNMINLYHSNNGKLYGTI